MLMKMNRRSFCKHAALMAGALTTVPLATTSCRSLRPRARESRIMTVTGAIAPEQAGLTLTHEHVYSIFGLDAALDPGYDYAAVSDAVLPHLRRVRMLGCVTLFDATAAYFGRDKRLMEAMG